MTFFFRLKNHIDKNLTIIWWGLPFNKRTKEKIKSFFFLKFECIFFNTRAYRNWKTSRFESQILSEESLLDLIEMHKVNMSSSYSPGLEYVPQSKVAVILHVYYWECFLDILARLVQNSGYYSKLYVTSPVEISSLVTEQLNKSGFTYVYLPTQNRGRDILPFLKIINHVINEGPQVFLKLHTKKSNHLKTGDLWREDILSKLLSKEVAGKVLHRMNKDNDIGMIGPDGHLVPISLYYGANATKLIKLTASMGVEPSELSKLSFFAGTMFYAKTQSIWPLMQLGLSDENFEPEEGQLDGTMAHVIERAFAVSTFAANLSLIDTKALNEKAKSRITFNHRFSR